MQVNNVSSTTQASITPTAQAAKGSEVDASQFMQILMAQLTNQNPLEPMNNAEMMSQFSQLNSLQELRDMHVAMDGVSSSNQTAYAASLIGKTVKVNRPDGNFLVGVVDGAVLEKDNFQLRIGAETVALSDVIEINSGVKA
jgi:flagellar basal-body rod modification protein FlgD